MLHLIPRSLHRLAYRAAHTGRKLWWRWRRPMIHGVSVIARNSDGALLFVRPSYGHKTWQFPGGGVEPGEDPHIAAVREFAEETGLELRDAQLLGQQVEDLHGAYHIAYVVTGLAEGEPAADGREIVAARWFARDRLPQERSKAADRRLKLLDGGRLEQR